MAGGKMLKTIQSSLVIFCLITIASHAKPNETPKISITPEWIKEQTVNYHAETIAGSIADGIQYLMVNSQQKYTNNNTYYFQHYAQKVINESGLSDSATIEISFNPSFQELEFHEISILRNGQRINHLDLANIKILHREENSEKQIYDGSLTATMLLSDVRIGDILEYSYSLIGQNSVFENQAYDYFNLGWGPIVDKRFLRILLPAERSLNIKGHNVNLEPTVIQTDGVKEYIWDIDNTLGHNPDKDIPDWLSPYPWVEISESTNWQEVAIWDVKNYATSKILPGGLEEIIHDIAEKHTFPKDRYRAILEYTQKEIRYLGIEIGRGSYIPRPPSVTYNNRFGDCKDKTILFLAMARKLGLPAYAAMVHSKKGEYLPERLPSLSLFNHVIVYFQLDGKNYWLDPTIYPQGGDLDNLYQPDYGYALIIDEQTTHLTRMNSEKLASDHKTVEEKFDLSNGYDKPVKYTIKTTYRSWLADNIRREFQNNAPQSISQNYINYYAKSYPDISIFTPLIFEDDLINNKFTIIENYSLEAPWIENPDKQRLELSFSSYEIDNSMSKTSTPIRSMPLKISFPVKVRQKIMVHLPDSWDIKNDEFIVENNAFKYHFSERYDNKILTLEYKYETVEKLISADSAQQYNKDVSRIFRQSSYMLSREDPNAPEYTPIADSSPSFYDENEEIISFILVIFFFVGLLIFIVYFRKKFTSRVNINTPYYPVALSKFILMNITTLGVYSVFWFFANWKYVQLKMNSSIWPFARAIFSPFTYFFLIKKFNEDTDANKEMNIILASCLAILYLLLSLIIQMTEDGILITMLTIVTTLCIVPFVIIINRNAGPLNEQFIENSRYRLSSYAGISLGGMILSIIFLSSTYFFPLGQTMYGNLMWDRDITYLKEKGLLSDEEKLRYFDTYELLSIKENGILFTDEKILSYWHNVDTGVLETETILLKDIRQVSFDKDDGLNVTLKDGAQYSFVLSTDDGIHLKIFHFLNKEKEN